MKTRVRVALLAVALLATPSVAVATTGGPEVAEPLGWDPKDRKVFFAIHSYDESARAPAVVYFAVDASNPERPQQVSWSADVIQGDKTYEANLAKLRRRLRRLHDLPSQTVFHYVRIESSDTLRNGYWSGARFHVIASDPDIGETFEVTTLIEPSVRMIRTLEVPGESVRLGVLSFRGIPYEMGYEVQIPVLLRRQPQDGAPRNIEWKRWR